MPGPFFHQIDPIFGEIGGVYLWYYGLSYTLGFLGLHIWFLRRHHHLGMTREQVYEVSLYLAVGVLAGGRLVEVVFYEWDFYREHLTYLPAYWLGGMSTHGLLLGGIAGALFFCRQHDRSFLEIADELVIPAAYIMGMGRVGNFIDGQIVGGLTDGWWGVQFPDAEGFRHPVVLYDGIKNLLLIPLLIWVRTSSPPRGLPLAHFLFWYAFLRFFVDFFRDYRVSLFSLGTGQVINLSMAAAGVALYVWFRNRLPEHVKKRRVKRIRLRGRQSRFSYRVKRIVFILILLFCLCIPSDWTQNIPDRYGHRHPGLQHSRLYPDIDTSGD